MQQAQLTIRIDQKLKKQAQNVARNFGLPLSSLIKVFLTNVVKTKKISLNEHAPLADDPEIAYLTAEIKKFTHKKFAGKKIPSLTEQLNNL